MAVVTLLTAACAKKKVAAAPPPPPTPAAAPSATQKPATPQSARAATARPPAATTPAARYPNATTRAALVLCLAGEVNRRAIIQPKALDTGWKVIPNLWGGIIGRPGFKKSPSIAAVTKPLKDIQAEWFCELANKTAISESALCWFTMGGNSGCVKNDGEEGRPVLSSTSRHR